MCNNQMRRAREALSALETAWDPSVVTSIKVQAAQLPPLVKKSPQGDKEKQELHGITYVETLSPDGEWGGEAHRCFSSKLLRNN